jgi:hypothetical protein
MLCRGGNGMRCTPITWSKRNNLVLTVGSFYFLYYPATASASRRVRGDGARMSELPPAQRAARLHTGCIWASGERLLLTKFKLACFATEIY